MDKEKVKELLDKCHSTRAVYYDKFGEYRNAILAAFEELEKRHGRDLVAYRDLLVAKHELEAEMDRLKGESWEYKRRLFQSKLHANKELGEKNSWIIRLQRMEFTARQRAEKAETRFKQVGGLEFITKYAENKASLERIVEPIRGIKSNVLRDAEHLLATHGYRYVAKTMEAICAHLEEKPSDINCNHCRHSNENDLCNMQHTERVPGDAGFAPMCIDFAEKLTIEKPSEPPQGIVLGETGTTGGYFCPHCKVSEPEHGHFNCKPTPEQRVRKVARGFLLRWFETLNDACHVAAEDSLTGLILKVLEDITVAESAERDSKSCEVCGDGAAWECAGCGEWFRLIKLKIIAESQPGRG